jgi:hypothetical protein
MSLRDRFAKRAKETVDIWTCDDDRRAGGTANPTDYGLRYADVPCTSQPVPSQVYDQPHLAVSGELRLYFLYQDLEDGIPNNAVLYEKTKNKAWIVAEPAAEWPNHFEVKVERVEFIPPEVSLF